VADLNNPCWTSDRLPAIERGANLGAILDRRTATLSFRRHSSLGWQTPLEFETTAINRAPAPQIAVQGNRVMITWCTFTRE
jgi:hypothetical protein